MRIESIDFKNYKLLRDATLPLEPLTVIVGPNGSGKSSVLEALRLVASGDGGTFSRAHTVGLPWEGKPVEVRVQGVEQSGRAAVTWRAARYHHPGEFSPLYSGYSAATDAERAIVDELQITTRSFRAFALVPDRMRQASALTPGMTLSSDGATLAVALDQLRDRDPDAWAALNEELGRWLPEFDAVLFDTPEAGMRAVALRTRHGRHKIAAADLSAGTLITLGLLAIAHGETAARVIGIEEPEVGIHPRLLRNVFDALLRMAYPVQNGVDRPPRQVIVTTHSPYFLDLFRDIPECVVIAERVGDAATFTRLTDRTDADDIMLGGSLGEAWFSGVLGGVPVEPDPPTVYPPGVPAAA